MCVVAGTDVDGVSYLTMASKQVRSDLPTSARMPVFSVVLLRALLRTPAIVSLCCVVTGPQMHTTHTSQQYAVKGITWEDNCMCPPHQGGWRGERGDVSRACIADAFLAVLLLAAGVQ